MPSTDIKPEPFEWKFERNLELEAAYAYRDAHWKRWARKPKPKPENPKP